MDKVTILNTNGRKISKDEMSPIVEIIYNKAISIAILLSQNYKTNNQRVEIVFDEISGNYKVNFRNCTKKYGNDFNTLFQQRMK